MPSGSRRECFGVNSQCDHEVVGRRPSVVGQGGGKTGIMSGSYRDLRVWQQAMKLAVEIYRATESFPKQELYGLTSQIRRAAISVPSNIAEGKGRHTDREFSPSLFHARSSLLEVETQIELARELRYLKEEEAAALFKATTAVGSSLTGLINSLRSGEVVTKPKFGLVVNRPPATDD